MNVIAGWFIACALLIGLGQIARAIDNHQCAPPIAAQQAAMQKETP